MATLHFRAVFAAAALGALAACSDAPTAPSASPPSQPSGAIDYYFTVTNTNDHGIGSLRWVLSYADSGQTIRFDPALAGQTITVDSVLEHHKAVTIEGPVDKGITISGGGKTRVFYLLGYGADTLRNVSITGGNDDGASALLSSSVRVVIANSTVYGNTGTGASGTVVNAPYLSLVNSTVSGNTAPGDGPAVASSMKMELINTTVAFNSGSGIGGTTNIFLRNSIVSNHRVKNCWSGAIHLDHLEGTNMSDDDTCGAPTDIMIADPKLAPLADNGGPTKTHALPVGSYAINAGTSCSVTVDQRYAQRDEKCDLGAYEFADFTTVTVTIDPGVAASQGNGWAIVSGTVTCSRSETFALAVQLAQSQKVGRGTTSVSAAVTVPVECSTAPRPWTASMVPTSGAFQVGSATASAQTVETEPWVASAAATSAVKVYWSRR